MNEAARAKKPAPPGPTYRETIAADAALLTPEWVASWTEIAVATAPPAPIFLVGFPRSGTTLLDTLLSNLPSARARGNARGRAGGDFARRQGAPGEPRHRAGAGAARALFRNPGLACAAGTRPDRGRQISAAHGADRAHPPHLPRCQNHFRRAASLRLRAELLHVEFQAELGDAQLHRSARDGAALRYCLRRLDAGRNAIAAQRPPRPLRTDDRRSRGRDAAAVRLSRFALGSEDAGRSGRGRPARDMSAPQAIRR